MAEPVIIDDGGSTRIKQLPPATKKMDDLLSDKSDSPEGTFSNLRIVFLEKDGTPSAPRDTPLDSRDTFTILSGNSQVVSGEMSSSGKRLTLALASTTAGVAPLIEAKHHGQQRRYVVSNAGPIEKVEFTDFSAGTGAQSLFDITQAPDKKTIYTMVILT